MTERLRALGFGLIVAYLVVAPLLFSVVAIESFEFPKVLLLRTLALGLLALGCVALAEWAIRGQLGTRVRGALGAASRDPIALGAAAWLLAGVLSTVASVSPHVSLHGDQQSFAGLTTLASYAVLFCAARVVVHSVADLRLALTAALAAGAGATTYGLLQLFGLDPIGWNITRSGSFERIASTMGNPNFLGGYLAMVFPAGLCLAIYTVRRGARVVSFAIALALAASAIVSVATLSRGVAIAHAAGIAALALGWWRTGERAGVAWIAGSTAAVVLLGGLLVAGTEAGRGYAGRAVHRLEKTLTPQRDLRIEFWTAAISMYRAEPVLGVGLDTFQLAFPRHAQPSFRRRIPDSTPRRAHNELLHTAATQGSVGVAAGLLFLGALVAGWLHALRLASDDEERMLLVAVGAGFAALLTRNLVSFTVVGLGGLACVLAGALASRAYGRAQGLGSAALSPRGERLAIGVGTAIASAAFLTAARIASAGSLAGAVAATAAIAAAVACIAFGLLFVERRGETAGLEAPIAGRRLLRLAASALVAVAFMLAVFQTVVRPALADLLAFRAKRLLEAKRPGAAVPFLENAVRLDPAREIHWVELGIAHHAAASSRSGADDGVRYDHLQRALGAQLRAATLVPGRVVNQANVARGFAELGSWAVAAPSDEKEREAARARLRAEVYARFDLALELDPFDRGVYFDATKAARGFRDEPALVRYASAWHEHHPAQAQARAQLGIAAMMRREWTTAETELSAATRLSWAGSLPDETGNWVNLSSTQLELGKPRDALVSSEAALGRVPLHLPALRSRARAHEALADTADALDPQRAIEHRQLAAADWASRLVARPEDAEARAALSRFEQRATGVPEIPAAGEPEEVGP